MHWASRSRGCGRLARIQEEVDATVNCIIVLIGRRWGRRGGRRISLSGGVILCVRVIDEGDVRLRVLYPELRVGHEVMDGGAGLWLFQALIGRQRAAECIHHSDLRGAHKGRKVSLTETQRPTARLHTRRQAYKVKLHISNTG